MALTYSDRPVLHYNGEPKEHWRSRFPPDAQPLTGVNAAPGTMLEIYEPSGDGWLAVRRRDMWEIYDLETGRLTGEGVTQPVMWAPLKQR